MDGTMHTPGQSAGNGVADLLGLGLDLEFVSPERRRLMAAPEHSQYANGAISLIDDMPMEVEMGETETEPTVPGRQEHSNGASLMDEQAPGRDLDFDHAVPRPIRAPRSRRNLYDAYPQHQQGDYYAPKPALYHDPDDPRGRACRYDREYREASPETLRNRAEASFVSAMADTDVKQERDDRRDGDRYRGGGNKRRRDGELATQHPRSLEDTNMHR